MQAISAKRAECTSTVLILGGIAVLTAASQIVIPLTPVPMTLQTLAILFIGMTYTPRDAFASVGGWIVLGLCGAPVFPGFSPALPTLLGPKAGYYVGFLLAALAMAWLCKRYKPQGLLRFTAIGLVGVCVFFTCGITWLAQFVGLKDAFVYGLAPFILWDGLKIVLAASVARGFRGSVEAG